MYPLMNLSLTLFFLSLIQSLQYCILSMGSIHSFYGFFFVSCMNEIFLCLAHLTQCPQIHPCCCKWWNSTPLCRDAVFLIHSSTDGYLDQFFILTTVNSSVVNTGARMSFYILIIVELLYDKSSLLNFWGPFLLFSIMAALVRLPSKNVWVLFSPHSHQHLLYFVFSLIAIQAGERWYFIVIFHLNCLTSDVDFIMFVLRLTN